MDKPALHNLLFLVALFGLRLTGRSRSIPPETIAKNIGKLQRLAVSLAQRRNMDVSLVESPMFHAYTDKLERRAHELAQELGINLSTSPKTQFELDGKHEIF